MVVMNYTEEKTLPLIHELCKEYEMAYEGHQGWRGIKTLLKLRCKKHSISWDSSRLERFMRSRPKCRICVREAQQAKRDETSISKLMATGRFREGTVFTRTEQLTSSGARGFFSYKCPVCSYDEYVENGLCTGIFTTQVSVRGSGCRCTKGPRWSMEQRQYQVVKLLREEGFKAAFVCWTDTDDMRMLLDCREHGLWETSASNFLHASSRCPSCAMTGFDPNKPAHVYIMKVNSASGGFTKVGITNCLTKRLRTHRKNLKDAGCFLQSFEAFLLDGYKVREIEAAVKKMFSAHPQDIVGFRTESFHYETYECILEFVKISVGEAYA